MWFVSLESKGSFELYPDSLFYTDERYLRVEREREYYRDLAQKYSGELDRLAKASANDLLSGYLRPEYQSEYDPSINRHILSIRLQPIAGVLSYADRSLFGFMEVSKQMERVTKEMAEMIMEDYRSAYPDR